MESERKTLADWHPPFDRTIHSFEERTGDADNFSCAIGRIVIWFADLEQEITNGIRQLLGHDEKSSLIITSEMSFKNRVHALASLIREKSSVRPFNIGSEPIESAIRVLIARCFQAEELRNKILHSSWHGQFLADAKSLRRKITAKATRGLHVTEEDVDADYLLDIADYICGVTMLVEEFMIPIDEAT